MPQSTQLETWHSTLCILNKDFQITQGSHPQTCHGLNLLGHGTLPMGVANRIERLKRNFLWDGKGEYSKFHLVNWKKFVLQSLMVVWGQKNLMFFNKTFLEKWLWRYHLKRDSLWRNAVDAKYEGKIGVLLKLGVGFMWNGIVEVHLDGMEGFC